MTLDRPTKTFIAVFTLVAALLLGVNHAVEQSPLENWWLPALLLLISLAFWIWMWQEKLDDESTSMTVVNSTEPEPLGAQEWIISKETPTVQKSSNSVSTAEDALRREMDKTVATITQTTETTEAAPPAEPAPVEKAEEPAKASVAEAKAEEPVAKSEPTPAPATSTDEVDDLERVEGIGPKYADALIAAGIKTFEDVANASVEQFEQAAKDAGMRRSASMSTWAEQAALAAKGDWDGLDALQERLSGGRR